MASSKVMATTSTTNSDLPCQPPPISSSLSGILADLQNQQEENPGDPTSSHPQSLGSMNMDDLLKNIYATPPPPESVSFTGSGASMTREGGKSVEEVWKEIVAGGGDQRRGGGGGGEEEMTLEDFLTKAGAVREEDVRGYENINNNIIINNNNTNNTTTTNNKINNNNQMVMVGPASGGGGGRGKRRFIEEPPLDKATQQKQRRMIKNRESAARSRERKQAYTVELESLVTHLEEENARLLREEAEQSKERFKQLMLNLIPIVEKRKPPRILRRVHSVHW